MKKTILFLLAITMLACAKPVTVTFSDSSKTYELENTNNKERPVAANVNWSIPVAASSDETVSTLINKTIADTLAMNTESPTFAAAVAEADLFCKDTIGVGYSNEMEWSGYQSGNVISIMLTSYQFRGGAHGNTTLSALTFDAQTGKSIDIKSHINDKASFFNIFIEQYCKEYEINKEIPMTDLGYFFELDSLWIPNTLLLTDEGVTGFYEQYEIACYAVGITSATVPYDKLKGILTLDVADIKPINIAK